jgi:RNA polymerase sigma-70 factor (ECF subfamily)
VLTEHAFSELYRATLRPLRTYAYRVTSNAADADDIVQEAFLRVLRADVSALPIEDQRRYLFRTAGHLMVDHWRRKQRERSALSGVKAEPAVEPETSVDLVDMFKALNLRDRSLLWLAYVEQQTHQEIADALDVKRTSVKVLLARARARLRDLLSTGKHNASSRC